MECPCEKRQGPKTLPDFISRSAEHSLWDGDIYMALYTTASCCRPKALAKSGTRANEWGDNASGRTRRRWLMCCAEESNKRAWFHELLKGVYHVTTVLKLKYFSLEVDADVKSITCAVLMHHVCSSVIHYRECFQYDQDLCKWFWSLCGSCVLHKHNKGVHLGKTH